MNFSFTWIFFWRRARFIFSTASRLKFGYSQVYFDRVRRLTGSDSSDAGLITWSRTSDAVNKLSFSPSLPSPNRLFSWSGPGGGSIPSTKVTTAVTVLALRRLPGFRFLHFYRATLCVARSLWSYFCPSVRPSVTLVHCVHVVRPTIMISSPYGSPIILVSGDITIITKFEGVTPIEGVEWGWGGYELTIFDQISRHISETVGDTTKVTIDH